MAERAPGLATACPRCVAPWVAPPAWIREEERSVIDHISDVSSRGGLRSWSLTPAGCVAAVSQKCWGH